MLSYWTNVELLYKHKVIEWIKNYWLNEYKIIE